MFLLQYDKFFLIHFLEVPVFTGKGQEKFTTFNKLQCI